MTALGIINLSALWQGQQTPNLVLRHCENFYHLHTAHVCQDSCFALTALGIIKLSALRQGQQTPNLVLCHCENFDHLNTLKQ